MPPVVGVATVAEFETLRAERLDPWDWWNPAEYDHFDTPATEPDLDPFVRGLCQAVSSHKKARAPVVSMLNRVAQRINALPWTAGSEPGTVAFATDLEGADVWRNMGEALAPTQARVLQASGALPR